MAFRSLGMYFIYTLETDGVIWYVGKTQDVKNRLRQHRSKKGYGADLIPKEYKWNMNIISETISEEDSIRKEQEAYDTLNPLFNKCRPGQTRSEYEESRRQHKLSYMKEYSKKTKDTKDSYNGIYYYENQEIIIQKAKAYRDANKDMINQRRRELRALKKCSTA
jgi:predicted GIY-YIG superfamily endonuclease